MGLAYSSPEMVYIIATFSVCYLARLSVSLRHITRAFFAGGVFFIGAVVACNSPASHDDPEMIWRVLRATGLGVFYVAGFFLFRYLASNEKN